MVDGHHLLDVVVLVEVEEDPASLAGILRHAAECAAMRVWIVTVDVLEKLPASIKLAKTVILRSADLEMKNCLYTRIYT